MSDPRPPLIFATVALAVSVGLGTGVGLLPESRTQTDPISETAAGSFSATAVPADTSVSLGQPFALSVGETAVLEDGPSVTFASVIGDSRCPADVQCVWEGNAEIEIEVAEAGESPAFLRLDTNPGFATEATYLTYTVGLIGLEPDPRTDSGTDEPYRASLVASTTGVQSPPVPSLPPSPAVLVFG